jgi:hypothetical protein
MATTLMPLDPATSPQRASRVLNISARLLPDEVVASRRARTMRGQVVVVLLLFVVLLGSWYGYAGFQKQAAQDELDGVTGDARVLQQRQSQFADVVNVQNETTTIGTQLTTLLADDLRWATLFDTLRSAGAGPGIVVVGVNGQLATDAAGSVGPGLPSTGAAKKIGELTVTGTAPDKTSLAKYVDGLGSLKVVANPYLTSATEAEGRVQFSLQVDITTDALGGRFTKKAVK